MHEPARSLAFGFRLLILTHSLLHFRGREQAPHGAVNAKVVKLTELYSRTHIAHTHKGTS